MYNTANYDLREDALSSTYIATKILDYSYLDSKLEKQEFCPTDVINTLHYRILTEGPAHVIMDVHEGESIGAATIEKGYKNYDLLSDRYMVPLTREAEICSLSENELQRMTQSCSHALAQAQDIRIARAIAANPLQIPVKEDNANNTGAALRRLSMQVFPAVEELLDHYQITCCVMNPFLWRILAPMFSGTSNTNFASGSPLDWADDVMPGTKWPVVLTPWLDHNRFYCIAKDADPLRCLTYKSVETTEKFEPSNNTTYIYGTVRRTVAESLRVAEDMPKWDAESGQKIVDESQDGNAGIVEVTLQGTAFFGTYWSFDDLNNLIREKNKRISKFCRSWVSTQMDLGSQMPTKNGGITDAHAETSQIHASFGETRRNAVTSQAKKAKKSSRSDDSDDFVITN